MSNSTQQKPSSCLRHTVYLKRKIREKKVYFSHKEIDFVPCIYIYILLVVQVVVCHGLEVEGLDPPGEARQELQAGGVAGSESGEEGDFFSKYRFFKQFSAEHF